MLPVVSVAGLELANIRKRHQWCQWREQPCRGGGGEGGCAPPPVFPLHITYALHKWLHNNYLYTAYRLVTPAGMPPALVPYVFTVCPVLHRPQTTVREPYTGRG